MLLGEYRLEVDSAGWLRLPCAKRLRRCFTRLPGWVRSRHSAPGSEGG